MPAAALTTLPHRLVPFIFTSLPCSLRVVRRRSLYRHVRQAGRGCSQKSSLSAAQSHCTFHTLAVAARTRFGSRCSTMISRNAGSTVQQSYVKNQNLIVYSLSSSQRRTPSYLMCPERRHSNSTSTENTLSVASFVSAHKPPTLRTIKSWVDSV